MKTLPCIACGKKLEDVGFNDENTNQPYKGTAFYTPGHYGSTVFDPMDGSKLEINVCDKCLKLASARQEVLYHEVGCLPVFWGKE